MATEDVPGFDRPFPALTPGHRHFGVHGYVPNSDRERAIIIEGYTPTMFQAWKGQKPGAAFIEAAPDHLKADRSGSAEWHWEQRDRTLDMPVAGGSTT